MSEKHGSIICIRLPYNTRYLAPSILFLIFPHKFSPFVLSAMNSVRGLWTYPHLVDIKISEEYNRRGEKDG
jgi:hypothetical protein